MALPSSPAYMALFPPRDGITKLTRMWQVRLEINPHCHQNTFIHSTRNGTGIKSGIFVQPSFPPKPHYSHLENDSSELYPKVTLNVGYAPTIVGVQ